MLNLSSEAPDNLIFTGVGYTPFDPYRPPPLGSDTQYTARNCTGTVVTGTTQEEADLIAALTSAQCQDPAGNLFFNDEAVATFRCPDGTVFTYHVHAGFFSGPNQLAADEFALAYARLRVSETHICLSELPKELCLGQHVSLTVTATSTNRILSWVIVGISPPLLSLVSDAPSNFFTAKLEGTTTSDGSYTFDILATDFFGNFMQKTYTICVIKMSPETLLPASIGSSYHQALSATSCALAPLSWQVETGSLPPGLTLDETTGVISGTPTTGGTYNFRISLQSSAT